MSLSASSDNDTFRNGFEATLGHWYQLSKEAEEEKNFEKFDILKDNNELGFTRVNSDVYYRPDLVNTLFSNM